MRIKGTTPSDDTFEVEDAGGVYVLILGLLVFGAAFTVVTLVEVLRAPDDQKLQSGSKAAWTAAILLTGVFGAFFYQVAGKPRHEVLQDPRDHRYWCKDCSFVTRDLVAADDHRRGKAATTQGSAYTHVAYKDPRDGLYWCGHCNFWSRDKLKARAHANLSMNPMPRPSPNATLAGTDSYLGFGSAPRSGQQPPSKPTTTVATKSPPTSQPPAASPPIPEFKNCPDCAESVRFAARKCRFCGYLFSSSAVPTV